VLATPNPVRLLISQDFGASYQGYQFKHPGGASDLEMDLQSGGVLVGASYVFFGGTEQVTQQQILFRLSLDGSSLLSLSLTETVTLSASVLMSPVVAGGSEDAMAFSVRYLNANSLWQNFVFKYDFVGLQTAWLLEMPEQTDYEDWLLSAGDGD